jgi:exopolysaccharide production protein ExoY
MMYQQPQVNAFLPATKADQANALPIWKRTIDLVCCVLALPIFLTLCITISVFERLTSPGPLFFTQERVGFSGRRFKLYKFRTMRAGVETESHKAHVISLLRSNQVMQKLDTRGDSRLIPGAWLLRSSGLDELPQIINVLRGEMSIVGPRPCLTCEFEQYSHQQRERFSSVPGLTGLWQVSGKNRTTFSEMVELDIAYNRSRSFFTDLQIIAKTPSALAEQVAHALRRFLKRREAKQTAPVATMSSETLSP